MYTSCCIYSMEKENMAWHTNAWKSGYAQGGICKGSLQYIHREFWWQEVGPWNGLHGEKAVFLEGGGVKK